jgi:AAA domain, putative AbiEii toxin, Type IV TA system
MLERLEFHEVGPAPKLAFDLAPRLNLLTGDNGVGKTFVLDVAWWALTRTWPGYPAAPRRDSTGAPSISFAYGGKSKKVEDNVPYDFESQSWPRPHGRPANPGMVLYARVDGSFSVWDPARNYWKKAPSLGVDAPDRPPAFHFSPAQVWDGLKAGEKALCNGLVQDWAFWQNGGARPFEQLKEALRALSPSAEERLEPGALTRISLDDARPIPTLKTGYGQEVPVVYASAGVKRIISLAYLLVWAWQEHVEASLLLKQEKTPRIIFLIDEIEAHLHPRWQRTVLRSILNVMKALTGDAGVEVQIIAVTHSPLLLTSLEPLFDETKDALWNLDLKDGAVELRKEVWRRRGDANAWLVSDVFDLEEPRSLEGEQAVHRAKALMTQKNVTPEEFNAAREQLRASMPEVDPFWVRFRFWAAEAGLET